MKKIWNLLYFGGIDQQSCKLIQNEVNIINKKSIVFYTSISIFIFSVLFIASITFAVNLKQNRIHYITALLANVIILGINYFVKNEESILVRISQYAFACTFLGIGMLMAISGKDDVTATYMVFLFVIPLLFTLRPIYMNSIILCSNGLYIHIMHQLEEPSLFRKNLLNALIYGALSIIVGTMLTKTKLEKYVTDYQNRHLMETDQLTGMLNRRSFEQQVQRLNEPNQVNGIKICAFDVNGLKQVNDNIGHHAGDELIRGAASCIENVFSRYGRCYRVGGDEFVAILEEASPNVDELKKMLLNQTTCFKGSFVPALSVSVGIVIGKDGDSVYDLLKKADEEMYTDKADYYSKVENNRRR